MRRIAKNGARFSKIVLENWKNFAPVEAAVQSRAFLVGPNASGKSNFLDVFRFLRDLASPGGGFREAIGRRGSVTAIRCLAARRYSDIAVGVFVEAGESSPPWKYELRFTQDKQRRPLVRGEKVIRDQDVLLDRRDDRGTPHLRGKYEHWRPQGAWQTEEQFSDGTLRLMGLL